MEDKTVYVVLSKEGVSTIDGKRENERTVVECIYETRKFAEHHIRTLFEAAQVRVDYARENGVPEEYINDYLDGEEDNNLCYMLWCGNKYLEFSIDILPLRDINILSKC